MMTVMLATPSGCWVSLASDQRTYPMFVPLGKQCIPLGREVCYWRILPRVYVLITCLLCISERGGANPSVACYSNISSDPWHEGLWVMGDGWQLIDLVGVEAGWHLSVMGVIFSYILVDWRRPYAWMVDCICANGSEQTRGRSPSGACNIG